MIDTMQEIGDDVNELFVFYDDLRHYFRDFENWNTFLGILKTGTLSSLFEGEFCVFSYFFLM